MKKQKINSNNIIPFIPENNEVWKWAITKANSDKLWANETKDNEIWLKNACTMSIELLNNVLNKSIEELAIEYYKHLKFRSHAGSSYYGDIVPIDKPAYDLWFKLTGIYPIINK